MAGSAIRALDRSAQQCGSQPRWLDLLDSLAVQQWFGEQQPDGDPRAAKVLASTLPLPSDFLLLNLIWCDETAWRSGMKAPTTAYTEVREQQFEISSHGRA